nr:hypothetical protein [uncultured Rhodopila sp.]
MISTVDRLRIAALPGMLGSSHGGERDDRKDWTSDCAIARKLPAQFEQRLRADPVYLAGWNSLAQ